jgi:predicted branched-subunit amino acid permease
MGVWAPLALSAATFAGSAQFAAVSVLQHDGGIAAAVLLNVRYVPIGISIARGFAGPPLRRFAESQLVVDESWAISIGGGRFDRRLLLGAGLAIYGAWLAGTAVGVVGSGAIGDPRRRRPRISP